MHFSDYVQPQNQEIDDSDHQVEAVPHPSLTRPEVAIETRYSRYGQLFLSIMAQRALVSTYAPCAVMRNPSQRVRQRQVVAFETAEAVEPNRP